MFWQIATVEPQTNPGIVGSLCCMFWVLLGWCSTSTAMYTAHDTTKQQNSSEACAQMTAFTRKGDDALP